MEQLQQLQQEIQQQENDVKELQELLQEDPTDEQMIELLKESQQCLETMRKQYNEMSLQFSSFSSSTQNDTIHLNDNNNDINLSQQPENKENRKQIKQYHINDKIYAYNQREKNWYSAMIIDIKTTEKETKYVVQFSY